jgi:hypothetical protein
LYDAAEDILRLDLRSNFASPVEFTALPEYIASAIFAAAIAAIGFLAKQVFELVAVHRAAKQSRRARLVTLLSLLEGSAAVYRVQAQLRNKLLQTITQRNPELDARHEGYERVFSTALPLMSNDERQLHSIIRAYTVSGLKPLNEAMVQWLHYDTEFKYARFRTSYYRILARQLKALEAHLLMWLAKYAAWIPEWPTHALVYLDDEEEHGVPFPKGIEETIRNVLKVPPEKA